MGQTIATLKVLRYRSFVAKQKAKAATVICIDHPGMYTDAALKDGTPP